MNRFSAKTHVLDFDNSGTQHEVQVAGYLRGLTELNSTIIYHSTRASIENLKEHSAVLEGIQLSDSGKFIPRPYGFWPILANLSKLRRADIKTGDVVFALTGTPSLIYALRFFLLFRNPRVVVLFHGLLRNLSKNDKPDHWVSALKGWPYIRPSRLLMGIATMLRLEEIFPSEIRYACLSREIEQNLVSKFPRLTNRTLVIHASAFSEWSCNRRERSAEGHEDLKPTLMVIGRKDQGFVSEFAKKNPNINLRILGWRGEAISGLNVKTRNSQNYSRCEIMELANECDAILFPRRVFPRHWSISGIPFEGIALQLPVVCEEEPSYLSMWGLDGGQFLSSEQFIENPKSSLDAALRRKPYKCFQSTYLDLCQIYD